MADVVGVGVDVVGVVVEDVVVEDVVGVQMVLRVVGTSNGSTRNASACQAVVYRTDFYPSVFV